MTIFELFGSIDLKGMGKVQTDLTNLEKRTQKVQTGLKVMGAAFTAVGGFGLAMIQSTKAINAGLSVTAINLGITTKEMRDLVLATTNVTFSIDEVAASFDFLARAGVKDIDILKATATAFDTLGDAIGMGASAVTEVMVPAMKTFRLSAEEIADKTDLMTYMIRNSTISLEDFNTMVGYTDQEMVDAGFTIDDMAAAMIYMSDQGVEPGRVMLREWMKAVTESKEENISMTEALGMTSEELETYKGKLEGATGLTDEFADAANEQYTILDKVKQKIGELTLKMSGLLEPLEPILVGMTALGPIIMIAGTAAGAAAIKWVIHTTALIAHRIAALASAAANWVLDASLGPVGWAILAVGTAIATLLPLMQALTGETKGLSGEMLRNRIEASLSAAEWEEAAERGYLLETQLDKMAEKLGFTTAGLMLSLKAIGMWDESLNQGTFAGKLYIQVLEEQATGLVKVRQEMREATSEQEALTRSWDDFMQKLHPSTVAFRDYGLTALDVVNYLAQTQGSIDAVVRSLEEQGIAAQDVQYHLDDLGISAEDVAAAVGKKKRAIIEEIDVDAEATTAMDALARSWDNFVREIAPGTKAFREYGLTTEDVIGYMVKMEGSMGAVKRILDEQGIAVHDVRYFLDELGIAAKDVADSVGKKSRAIAEETVVDLAAADAAEGLSDVLYRSRRPPEGFIVPELAQPVSMFPIEINGMVIREEADIYKVAEDLYRISQDRVRAFGG